ncbi:MAG: EamA family transporter [Chthoniobacterales bacterium]
MSQQAILALPATSAFLYVLAALFIKKAITAGCRQGHVNIVVNLLPAVVFQLLWLRADGVNWSHAWMPAVTALTFFLGQIFTFLALRNGEVSVTTPLLGTKVVFTAVLGAMLLGQALTLRWWLGALACSLGVMLVTGATLRSLLPRLRRRDAMFSLGAAAAFGLTDVLVQHWTHFLGVPAFVALMFGITGVIVLVVFLPGAGRAMPRAGIAPLLSGTGLYTLQIFGMAVALGLHESATAVNIVYGSRAVWSVALAWMLARLLHAEEARDPRDVMLRRLAGALLIFGAVLAVLI